VLRELLRLGSLPARPASGLEGSTRSDLHTAPSVVSAQPKLPVRCVTHVHVAGSVYHAKRRLLTLLPLGHVHAARMRTHCLFTPSKLSIYSLSYSGNLGASRNLTGGCCRLLVSARAGAAMGQHQGVAIARRWWR
jgi:hypothetical protein